MTRMKPTTSTENLMPGFYTRSDLHETVIFWDGKQWTDHMMPAPVVPEPVTISTIAWGVALGTFLTVVLAVILGAVFGLLTV